jgi:hypothetical protein
VPWRGTLTVSLSTLFPPQPVEIAGVMAFGFAPAGLVDSHSVQLTSFAGREISAELLDELSAWLSWLLPLGTSSGGGLIQSPRLPPNPARLVQLLAAAARSSLMPQQPPPLALVCRECLLKFPNSMLLSRSPRSR